MKKTLALLTFSLLSAACSEVPPEAFSNRGSPESLLDVSSEVVNISLADPAGASELMRWINQEQPSRADVACVDSDPACRRAKGILRQFNVPYDQKAQAGNAIMLHYERVMARNCENRFIDNTINPYNLYHPTFGCSVAANSVQQVADKRQFVNPGLLEFMDGEKAVQTYRNYQQPSKGLGGSMIKNDSVEATGRDAGGK